MKYIYTATKVATYTPTFHFRQPFSHFLSEAGGAVTHCKGIEIFIKSNIFTYIFETVVYFIKKRKKMHIKRILTIITLVKYAIYL